MFEKAAQSKADQIFLDLEDAVAPDDKEQARKNIIQGLNDVDWGKKVDDAAHQRPRHAILLSRRRGRIENCPRLDIVLIPKVGVPADVYAIDMMITQIEQYKKRTKKIGIEILIETASGWPMSKHRAVVQAP